jgi:hypothetical protein
MSAFRFDGTVRNNIGEALAGVEIFVCTQPVTSSLNPIAIPPSPLASLFTSASGSTPLANPVVTDGNGNYFFYAATGTYTIIFFDPYNRIPTVAFADQQVVTQGGGSVTSVALTVPARQTVTGSPITASGTFAISDNNQNANSFLRGPNSGGPGAVSFGPIVAADLSGLGVGTVTSVTAAISASALFSASITGTNPITASGTFTINLAFANQAANLLLASPASGGSGPITARAAVAADVCGVAVVGFSASPTFDASTFAFPTFTMTLTGNVTSSSVSNARAGQRIIFVLTQDIVGGRTFAWPANFKAPSNVDGTANSVSVQGFVYDGTNWRAESAGSFNGS